MPAKVIFIGVGCCTTIRLLLCHSLHRSVSLMSMLYKFFIKTPLIAKRLFPSYRWSFPTDEKIIYLTFDDGPHPTITPFVLEKLEQYNAKATFFCVGNNVVQYSKVYQQILAHGHAVGNHTFDHPNGWATSTDSYVSNVAEASKYIDSNLFRPPYGKLKNSQAKKLPEAMHKPVHIIMWDVLSADFIRGISKEQCLRNVLSNYANGSVIVFHDSEKAYSNLEYAFPETLRILSEEGFRFKKIIL